MMFSPMPPRAKTFAYILGSKNFPFFRIRGKGKKLLFFKDQLPLLMNIKTDLFISNIDRRKTEKES